MGSQNTWVEQTIQRILALLVLSPRYSVMISDDSQAPMVKVIFKGGRIEVLGSNNQGGPWQPLLLPIIRASDERGWAREEIPFLQSYLVELFRWTQTRWVYALHFETNYEPWLLSPTRFERRSVLGD